MRAPVLVSGAVLVALGLSVFAWKVFVLDMPMRPSDPEGMWRVDLEIRVRGTGSRGAVLAALPTSEPGQRVFGESAVSDRLQYSERERLGQRLGVWSGALSGVHELGHSFRVELSPTRARLPRGSAALPPAEVVELYLGPSTALPARASIVNELLGDLELPGAEDPAGRLRALFAFAADEVATVDEESDDALLTLVAREGSPLGKARLLATLLRAGGLPARVAHGLQLREGQLPREAVWVESWLDGGWVPMSPSDGFFAERPADLLVLHRAERATVEARGAVSHAHRHRAMRERLGAAELATMMESPNPWAARLSLFRLPVAAQASLRLLLLVPLGALATAFFRNVVGVQTYGTFMPVLLALAWRTTDLVSGLGMLAVVLALGVFSRVTMDRLHLLLVPRLCILLCVVVLGVTGLAVVGGGVESRGLLGGVLLPIVILTMLIERFSVTSAEEGFSAASLQLAWTTAVAIAVYPIFASETAEHLMFGFPELIFAVMGVLIWIGGYTGYRLSELMRFRELAAEIPEGGGGTSR